MKHRIILQPLLFVMVALMAFTCKKKTDEPANTDIPQKYSEALVGGWHFVQLHYIEREDGTKIQDCTITDYQMQQYADTLIFYPDFTYNEKYSKHNNTEKGTYVADGKYINTLSDTRLEKQTEYTLSGQQLLLYVQFEHTQNGKLTKGESYITYNRY